MKVDRYRRLRTFVATVLVGASAYNVLGAYDDCVCVNVTIGYPQIDDLGLVLAS